MSRRERDEELEKGDQKGVPMGVQKKSQKANQKGGNELINRQKGRPEERPRGKQEEEAQRICRAGGNETWALPQRSKGSKLTNDEKCPLSLVN